jgi:branched-chain amino acid transport system substrate-binding protein
MNRIYASLPVSGPQGAVGRDLIRAAELALERLAESIAELVVLDSFDQRASANASRAAEDDQAVAYIGDFGSAEVLVSAPILGKAGLLGVAPVATFAGLRGPTLVRLMPHDGVGARAIAAWLVEMDVQELLVVHDHDEGYGVPVGRMCVDAARERGLSVRSRPVWDHDESLASDLDGAQAVLYVGVAGSGAVAMWHQLHSLRPGLWLLGTAGVAVEWLARELEPAVAERTRFFVAQRAPFGFYGFEAMSLVLDAIAEAGGDRRAVVRLVRGTRGRDSILGRYSIDEDGHTTMTAYGRLAVAGGELVWDAG